MIETLMMYWPIWLLAGEIAIILGLYRFVLREWIVSHWENKITQDDGEWLCELLSPVTQEVCENILTLAPRLVVDTVKHELLSSQGNLTRVSKPDESNEVEVGLSMAEGLLKELGLKNPNIIMVSRLAKSLLGRLEANDSQTEPDNEITKVKIGQELLHDL